MSTDIPASVVNDDGQIVREYPSWDALVAEEANGYIVTVIGTRSGTVWAWTVGPFPDKATARTRAARERRRIKRHRERNPWWEHRDAVFVVQVRPLWKPEKAS